MPEWNSPSCVFCSLIAGAQRGEKILRDQRAHRLLHPPVLVSLCVVMGERRIELGIDRPGNIGRALPVDNADVAQIQPVKLRRSRSRINARLRPAVAKGMHGEHPLEHRTAPFVVSAVCSGSGRWARLGAHGLLVDDPGTGAGDRANKGMARRLPA